MNIWKETWADALEMSISLVKKYPLITICTFLCGFLLNGYIESPFGASPTSSTDTERIIGSMTLALWDLTSNMIVFALTTLIPVNPRLMEGQREILWDKEAFYSLAAESLRVLGIVLLYSLLLIIPGFIQYVRLSFVPYLVFYSKEYRLGNINALERSKQLTKPILIPLLGLTVLIGALMIVLEMLPQIYTELHNPPLRFTFELMAFAVGIYGFSLSRILFHKSLVNFAKMNLGEKI